MGGGSVAFRSNADVGQDVPPGMVAHRFPRYHEDMRHDPSGNLRVSLTKALARQMSPDEAGRIAGEVTDGFFTSVDVGGPHFELLNVTLRWKALCGEVAEGRLASGTAGLSLIVGALRWFDSMRYYHQFGGTSSFDQRYHRERIDFDHVDAATCLALWRREAAAPRPPGEASLDPRDVLLPDVTDVLGRGREAVDRQRLREAVDRLETVECVQPRDGWYGLRVEMAYQVPEE